MHKETKKCSVCKKNAAQEEHTCPFREDVNDDHDSLCDCCDECEQNCCDNILINLIRSHD